MLLRHLAVCGHFLPYGRDLGFIWWVFKLQETGIPFLPLQLFPLVVVAGWWEESVFATPGRKAEGEWTGSMVVAQKGMVLDGVDCSKTSVEIYSIFPKIVHVAQGFDTRIGE